jgi:hypothetical protein
MVTGSAIGVVEREGVLAGADVVRFGEQFARGAGRPVPGDGLDVDDLRGGDDFVAVFAGRGGDGLGADDGDDDVQFGRVGDELLFDPGEAVGAEGGRQLGGDLDGHVVCSFRYSCR